MKEINPMIRICAILLYRFLRIMVMSIPINAQYAMNIPMLWLFTMVFSDRSCLPIHQSMFAYANIDPTMMIPRPSVFRVIQILIFFCEKIVFMIRIRTYITIMLVMIGRTILTMKWIHDKTHLKQQIDWDWLRLIETDWDWLRLIETDVI